MSDTYRFWTHGASVIPEFTLNFTGHDNDLHLRPSGHGAVIRQSAGTWNWFHFAIPTPTDLDDDHVERKAAYLRTKISSAARIDHVNIHEAGGADGVNNSPAIYRSADSHPDRDLNDDENRVKWSSRTDQFEFGLDGKRCMGPLVMSVKVVFSEGSDEQRQITFTGAGAWFEEVY